MPTTYGITKTFGSWTFSNHGFHSKEAALENVYQRAFEKRVWAPPLLRKKWWQFWRPVEHTDIEKKFASKAQITP